MPNSQTNWMNQHLICFCRESGETVSSRNKKGVYQMLHPLGKPFVLCWSFKYDHWYIYHNIDITQHNITLHCITLHYITFHCIALHYITFHCIALHYISLHCIALHYISLSLSLSLSLCIYIYIIVHTQIQYIYIYTHSDTYMNDW